MVRPRPPRKTVVVDRGEVVSKRSALAKIAERFKSPKACDLFEEVESIPTDLIQMDHALRVGGCPVGRVGIIHGPTHEGKSFLALLLAKSFVSRGHFGLYADAERTMSSTWMREVLTREVFESEFFRGEKPDTYEATVLAVRSYCKLIVEARSEGAVDPNTRGVAIIDSLRKLVPEGSFDMMAKDKSDAFVGRGAQRQAQLNAAWMDEVVPLMDRSKVQLFIIGREIEDVNADQWSKQFGNDWKIGGGRSVPLDSSLCMRVTRTWVKEGETVVGEKHKVTVWKSKISGKDDKVTKWYFYTSNGVAYEAGHDKARDLLELAEFLEVVTLSGATLLYDSKRYRGRDAMLRILRQDLALQRQLELATRAKFAVKEPELDTDAAE